jgi:copper(I)-binding protein
MHLEVANRKKTFSTVVAFTLMNQSKACNDIIIIENVQGQEIHKRIKDGKIMQR